MSDLFELHDLPTYLSGVWLLLALVGMGLVVGVLTGLFGVGGAFVIVPMLNVLLGVPYSLGTGSSMSFTLGTSAAGWARHMRMGNVATKTMLILAGGAVCGTILGADLHHCLKAVLGEEPFTLTMHGLFLAVMGVAAWLVAAWSPHEAQGPTLLQRLPIGPRITIRRAGLGRVSLPGLCAVGLGIGVFKGLLGIGGGVLFMPIMLLVVGLTIRQSVGTSLGVVLLSSLIGAGLYGAKGHVNLWIVMALLAGSTFGVQIGAGLSEKLHARSIQKYFALFVLGVMAVLMWDFVRQLV